MIASAALALTLAAASSAGARIEDLGWNRNFPVPCDVTVSFGSYANGPNMAVYEKVRAYVNRSKDVRRAMQHAWGREGERTLCLVVQPNRTSKVYADLRRMIPTYASRGPTSVSSRAGARFESKPAK